MNETPEERLFNSLWADLMDRMPYHMNLGWIEA